MDLITELENDVALAVIFEKYGDKDERDVRELIAKIDTALSTLSDIPERRTRDKRRSAGIRSGGDHAG